MALLKEHISQVTSILNNSGEVSDDYQYSDQQIYFILKSVRSYLLRQRITEGKYISPYNYQTIPCFKLALQTIQDCECFDSTCKALQSNCSLPTLITTQKGLGIQGVYTVNSPKPTRLDNLTYDSFRLSQYSKTMQDVKGWFMTDNARLLTVTGYTRLAAVKVTGLFDDPLAVAMMSTDCGCNEDGSPICVDPYEFEFPLDSDLSKSLWSLTYDDILKVALKMNVDLKNDAKGAYGALEKK
jgi:hypothetical protein